MEPEEDQILTRSYTIHEMFVNLVEIPAVLVTAVFGPIQDDFGTYWTIESINAQEMMDTTATQMAALLRDGPNQIAGQLLKVADKGLVYEKPPKEAWKVLEDFCVPRIRAAHGIAIGGLPNG